MSTHPTPQTMSTNVNTGSQSITENAVVLSTSQAVVPSNLGTLMKNANIDKTSPYYLAERIESFGNAGATLFIQQGTDITHLTNKFYLQGMNISLKERVQIQETFGSPIASFFGESVKVYNFSGVCLEYASTRASKKGEYFQGSSLMHLYNHSMRGTQLVKSNSIAVLQVMNHTIWGYPIAMNFVANSDHDKVMQFSLSFLVKEHTTEFIGVVSDTDLEANNKMHESTFTETQETLTALKTAAFDLAKYTGDIGYGLSQGILEKESKEELQGDFDTHLTAYTTTVNASLASTVKLTELYTILGESPPVGNDTSPALAESIETALSTAWEQAFEEQENVLLEASDKLWQVKNRLTVKEATWAHQSTTNLGLSTPVTS